MKRGRSSVRISALGLWVACGSFFFLLGAFAADPVFLRGDANADGQVSISDAMTILNTPVEELPCAKAADIDDDGSVTLRSMNEPRMLRAFIFSPLMALNTGFPQPRPPFPEPGTDPSSDSLGCSGYIVVPPVVAQGSVRIGEVRGSAGQIVETPVYLTNSEEVEAFQLVVCYDPAVSQPMFDLFGNVDELVSLEGTFYEPLQNEPTIFWDGFNLPEDHTLVLGFYGNGFGVSYNVPPGSDRPVLKLRFKVLPGAAPDTVIAPRLTNGTGGLGVFAPYNLRNELTVAGKAKLLEVPPNTCESVPPTENPFLRGDVNTDGRVSLSDAAMLRRWYSTEEVLDCLDAADANDDGKLDARDGLDLLIAIFLGGPVTPAPFPQSGDDPTGDRIGCAGYAPVPSRETEDVVRVGEVEAAPGQEIMIPIYLTSSEPVEAIQVAVTYDPRILSLRVLNFSGTFYETLYPGGTHQPDVSILRGYRDQGFFIVALMGSLTSDGYEVPPGSEVLVAKVRAAVSPDAEPGTTISFDLTNGPSGDGVVPPYNLRNELTYQGAGKFLSVLPRRIAGKLAIVDDITFFIRGDATGDDRVDVSDAVFTIGHLFLGGQDPRCADAEDADDNGRLELTDAVVILGQLFTAEATIAAPYPTAGRDEVFDNLPPCHN